MGFVRSLLLILAGLALATVTLAANSATATFVGFDTNTRGNWQQVYGKGGYSIANSTQQLPSYASLLFQNNFSYTWDAGTNDTRALQTSTGVRLASCWYNNPGFTVDVNITDGNSHQVSLYILDWDSVSTAVRGETIQVIDAISGAVLDTRNDTNFTGGAYAIWNVSGHVQFKLVRTSGANSVVSGVFFDIIQGSTTTSLSTSTGSASATYVGADTNTQGNWANSYGADGYAISSSAQSVPAYAQFTPKNQLNYVWTSGVSDPRALQVPASSRVASCWYAAATFSLDVNITDGTTHQIAVYALDWDSASRAENIQILNAATNAILDSRQISGFNGGMYVIWNISGHVTISVTRTAGSNSVISGVFFGAASKTQSNTSTTTTTSQTNTTTSSITNTSASGLPPGLVLRWTLDKTGISGTTVTDSSNNGGTGSMYGGLSSITGPVNQALQFNGVNSYVGMGAASDPGTTFNRSMTLAAWIKTTNNSRVESIISKFSAGGSGAGYIFRTVPNGNVAIVFGADDLVSYPGGATDTTKINDGQWHHVVAVITMGASVQFYVDGKSTLTNAVYTAPGGDGLADLEVGSSSYLPYGNYFTGGIDDIQIYNRPLSAAEVNTIFALGSVTQTTTSNTQTTNSNTQTTTSNTTTTPSAPSQTAPVTPAPAVLSATSASYSFGSVNVGLTNSTVINLSNTGSSTATISNVTVSGAGFNATGISNGVVLTPGQSAAINVAFAPASTGSAAGKITIASNASNASLVISLSGTGLAVQHSIALSWAASSSSGVVGYEVYRGTAEAGPYALITSAPISAISFTDTTGQVGQTYYYVVTSVDSNNAQSTYSNAVSATIP